MAAETTYSLAPGDGHPSLDSRPCVSILMSVFNGEEYLRSAIQSIMDQTVDAWEALVVDDGSTDSSARIVAEYAAVDQRVHLLQIDHSGQARALNHGLAFVRAPYVARIDHDDLMKPHRLADQLECMTENQDLVLLGSSAEFVDSTGRPYFVHQMPLDDSSLRKALVRYNPFFHSATMLRTDAAREVGGYRDLPAAQDYDLWMRMSRVGQLGNLGEPLVSLRIHRARVTERRRRQQQRCHLRVQWLAVSRGWYSPLSVRHMLRPAVMMVLPEFAAQEVYRLRVRRNVGHRCAR